MPSSNSYLSHTVFFIAHLLERCSLFSFHVSFNCIKLSVRPPRAKSSENKFSLRETIRVYKIMAKVQIRVSFNGQIYNSYFFSFLRNKKFNSIQIFFPWICIFRPTIFYLDIFFVTKKNHRPQYISVHLLFPVFRIKNMFTILQCQRPLLLSFADSNKKKLAE